ncbi:S8 family serine peptidase [Aestuariibacter sp. AA17]|uniref:S8 family serine peptidase n=2 Tax=Fluctibacter corallii TaxID=2984329 RepID=A0ABT3A653_9ALTE|nr:S8 family serine peptidase [Aestuariibacter sp. AA17]MCV2884160.1 S8 family serine peptidase [Aestuariibacter sp. AA17]
MQVAASHPVLDAVASADDQKVTIDFGKDFQQERYIVTFKDRGSKGGHSAINGKSSMQSEGAQDALNNSFLLPNAAASIDNVVTNGELNEVNASRLMSAVGAKHIKTIKKQKMMAVTMNKLAINMLKSNPFVESVSLDPKRYLQAQSTPYGITMVQAPLLNQSNTAARTACVIDTGYNLGHPDLPNQSGGVSGNANNNQVGNWYNDGNGHGTHVAGTIAALSNNEGVVGVYPGVDLHIVKIFNDNGQWTFASDLIDGIQQCADAGADVVNMSLGGGSSSTAEANAMQNFVNQGVMLVAAAGNGGNSSFSYPASYDAVISVAAVTSSESRASYSQYNSQVEIAGPGSAVESTWPTNTYNTISGTSMATPHVVGAAALVWSFFPQCTNEQIRNALNDSAKDKGAAGRDNFYGHGIVQAKDAFDYLTQYGCDGDGGDNGGGEVEPVNGSVPNLSGGTGSWTRYTWDIPANVQTMTLRIAGGTGDADLYTNFGSQTTTSNWNCRPYLYGNAEECTFSNPQAGTWHIGIRGYTSYSGVTLYYSYQ